MIDPIRAESIRALYLQMRTAGVASLVGVLYMVGAGALFSDRQSVVVWTAMILIIQISRQVLILRFHREKLPDEHLEFWAKAFVVHQALAGLVWGTSMFLFAHPDQPVSVCVIVCGLSFIVAGAVAAQAYTPASFHALNVSVAVLTVTRLVTTEDPPFILLGIVSAVYALAMTAFSRGQARLLHDGFRIRFENAALFREVSAQKAVAEEARKEAEQASLAKSQFLAAASHDLRQPLYALSLFSASLDTLRLDSDSHRVVAGISENIAAMEAMFAGLLDVSRLDAGVVEVAREPISIDSLFDRLSQVFRPLAVRQGLDLRFRSTDEWVNSDRTLLEQVLGNFLSNALRYTHRGGVLVAARTRGDTVRLEIWDTGIGISDADVGRIFDEYVQLGNPERERRNGIGLGLSIAQRSAELLGTAVGVRSRPGRGSCFSISQPASEHRVIPSVQVATEAARTPRPSSDLPILVVDDDRDIRLALANLLTRWDVRHEIVASADAALARVADGHAFRLLIADYRLPGRTDGLSLLSELAQSHPAPKPPGVLITGDFDVQLIGAARDAGVALFHKPITPEVLRGIIGLPASAPGGRALMDALPD